MPDLLIALGILALLGVGVYVLRAKSSSREERRRAKAIADANGRHEPLTDEEREHADAIHEIVQEARTGDLPKYVDAPRRPTVREVARKYRRPAKHSAKRLPKTRSSNPLTGPLPPQMEQTVMLPGPPPAWHLESFTDRWTKDEIDVILAKGKAGASR